MSCLRIKIRDMATKEHGGAFHLKATVSIVCSVTSDTPSWVCLFDSIGRALFDIDGKQLLAKK